MNRRMLFAAATALLLLAPVGPSEADTSDLQASIDSVHEPIFDGLGSLHHPVTTKTNPALAQQFFDQGLTFIYAFNLDEAADSFRQAAQYDPDMAMAYWGIALALGPNINEPEDIDRGKMAYAAIAKAKSLEANASEPEREYIDALAMRYGADGKMTDVQQLAYANATREGVIAKHPDHIGANHYYIHAVEASPDPGRGLPSAQRLPKLAPAAGHIVHMPSHIYFRIGDYDASVNANLAAIKADKVYLRERNPKGMFTMNYVAHNDAFLWASYMMEGNSRGAFKASRALDDALPLDLVRQMPMAEGASPSRYFTYARFGKWDEILKELAPPADLTYTTAIWHYARGLALAAKNRPGDAQKEQDKLDEIIAATPLGRMAGFNPANRLLALAAATLAGEIASANGNHDEAIKQLQAAVAIQDALNYDEPPDWYYPVRETLGMELLADGKTAEAEEVFREDLKRNPENGWSLNGLAICLRARNASDEAASVEARFKKAWAHADVTLPASAAPEKTTAAR